MVYGGEQKSKFVEIGRRDDLWEVREKTVTTPESLVYVLMGMRVKAVDKLRSHLSH